MIVLLLLILIPAVLAGLSFVVSSDARRPWMLVVAGVLHMALVTRLWVSGDFPSLGAWMTLDAAGKLVLTLSSTLFLGASVYAIGYLRRRAERPNKVFVASLLF